MKHSNPFSKSFRCLGPALPLVALLLTTGCRSPVFEGTVFAPRPDTEGARLQLAYEQMGAEAARNQSRLDALEQTQRQMEANLLSIEKQLLAEAGLRAEVAVLRREVGTLRAEREQLRKEIVDDLSGRISRMMAAQASAGGTGTTRPTGAGGRQSGRLHKVERGQTLSEIARAYNSTTRAIMQANNISDGHLIREGQELFIPD
jgi:nucleoid-associated protein YgaU